jgi:hypothetical protein
VFLVPLENTHTSILPDKLFSGVRLSLENFPLLTNSLVSINQTDTERLNEGDSSLLKRRTTPQ